MPRSYSQPIDLECPGCGQPFRARAWLLVDAGERPDLAEAVRAGTIHDVSCAHCGQVGAIPAPLLYHDPARRRVLFAVPPGMDEASWREEAQGLLWMLIGELPVEERLPYLGELQAEAGIAGLAHALRESAVPSSPIEALGESFAADEDEVPLLVEAVLALLEVQSAEEAQRIFVAYPFLLDETMDVGLADLAAAAREQGELEAAAGFERAREIMAQLRPLVQASRQQAPREVAQPPAAPEGRPGAGDVVGTREEPAEPPPAGWGTVLRLLLDPQQELELEELQARQPLLGHAQAPTWLAGEIERRRSVGHLMEVQLLQEWLQQIEAQRSGGAI